MTIIEQINAMRKQLLANNASFRSRVQHHMFERALKHYAGVDIIDSELSTEVIEHDNKLWYRLRVTLIDATNIWSKPIIRNYNVECTTIDGFKNI